MRSGIALSVLRTEVLIEARVSTTTNQSPQMTDRIRQLLNRFERDYATRYRWKTRKFEGDITVLADASLALLPSGMTFTMVTSVECKEGDLYYPVVHGIGALERSWTGEGGRILRWEIQSTNPLQYEVWPVAGEDRVLHFTAERAAGVMVADVDTCVLDGDMLVLRAAAEILKPTDFKDAQDKALQAEALAQSTLTREASTEAPIILSGGRPYPRLRPGIDYIPPGS